MPHSECWSALLIGQRGRTEDQVSEAEACRGKCLSGGMQRKTNDEAQQNASRAGRVTHRDTLGGSPSAH